MWTDACYAGRMDACHHHQRRRQGALLSEGCCSEGVFCALVAAALADDITGTDFPFEGCVRDPRQNRFYSKLIKNE